MGDPYLRLGSGGWADNSQRLARDLWEIRGKSRTTRPVANLSGPPPTPNRE